MKKRNYSMLLVLAFSLVDTTAILQAAGPADADVVAVQPGPKHTADRYLSWPEFLGRTDDEKELKEALTERLFDKALGPYAVYGKLRRIKNPSARIENLITSGICANFMEALTLYGWLNAAFSPDFDQPKEIRPHLSWRQLVDFKTESKKRFYGKILENPRFIEFVENLDGQSPHDFWINLWEQFDHKTESGRRAASGFVGTKLGDDDLGQRLFFCLVSAFDTYGPRDRGRLGGPTWKSLERKRKSTLQKPGRAGKNPARKLRRKSKS